MNKSHFQTPDELYNYILTASLREPEVLKALREETSKDPAAIMQIPPEQGQFMALLLKLISAKKTLELGTFTGYSALSAALAMPDDSLTISCDINEDWTNLARKYWKQAGVDKKIELRLGPALDSLDGLIHEGQSNSFDFVFIDADKTNYDGYYEKSLILLRPGGLIAIDNVFLFGSVLDSKLLREDLKTKISEADIQAMRRLNIKIKQDERVDISMLPVADGLTLVRKRTV